MPSLVLYNFAGSLAIRDPSKEDIEYTGLIPDHVIAVLTSLSLLLFSVVAAILLFVHKKGLLPRSSENPSKCILIFFYHFYCSLSFENLYIKKIFIFL